MKSTNLLLFVVLTASFVNLYGAVACIENWDDNSIGQWLANTTRSEVEAIISGGNPGGYLQCYEVENTYAIGALNKNSAYTGNYVSDGIVGVSADILLESGNYRGVWFRFIGSGNGWLFPITETFTPGIWISNEVTFDPSWSDQQARQAGWLTPHDKNPAATPSSSFHETMQNVGCVEIRFEGYCSDLVAGIDNYILIPEPTSLVLLSLGGLILPRKRKA